MNEAWENNKIVKTAVNEALYQAYLKVGGNDRTLAIDTSTWNVSGITEYWNTEICKAVRDAENAKEKQRLWEASKIRRESAIAAIGGALMILEDLKKQDLLDLFWENNKELAGDLMSVFNPGPQAY